MAKEFDRRTLLKLAGFAGASLLTRSCVGKLGEDDAEYHPFNTGHYEQPFIPDPVWKIEMDDNSEHLSYEEGIALARRFKAVDDKIEPVPLPASEDSAVAILMEYNPLFAEEDMVRNVNFPSKVEFKLYPPDRHSSVLGSSDCTNYIVFNVRTVNPVSTWYNREDFLWTAIHESAHMQQGQGVCGVVETELLEATAQLMTAEVVASRAVVGDNRAFKALTTELFDWSLGAAFGEAIKEDRLEEYKRDREKLLPGALNNSKLEKTLRKYELDMPRLQYILEAYSARPLNIAIDAIKNNNGMAEGLALPAVSDGGYFNTSYIPVLKLDDLTYFVKNMEEIGENLNG